VTRLHIGCGSSGIGGWTNIDCRETDTTDLVMNAWELIGIPHSSVEYIYARHMLEHLSPFDADRTLAEWWRVLSPGGIVHLVVPNIQYHAKQLLVMARDGSDEHEAHALAGFYGWQREKHGGGQEDAHRWGYTPISLARLLTEKDFVITDEGIEQLIDRDQAPWHINMRATKV
jgi:predicted SAM-dependent methyltransferase